MKRGTLSAAAALAALTLALGCPGPPGDPSGPDAADGSCFGGAVELPPIPLNVFCGVDRVEGSVSWTEPEPGSLAVTISPDNPTVEVTVPSGPNRQWEVRSYDSQDPGAVADSASGLICVAEGEPLRITVDVSTKSRNPGVSISPANGNVTAGQPMLLAASASDPDRCDRLGYRWTASAGKITPLGNGATATWVPQVPSAMARGAGVATVTVNVSDGRGGNGSATGTYTVAAAAGTTPPPPPPPVHTLAVTSIGVVNLPGLKALTVNWADSDPAHTVTCNMPVHTGGTCSSLVVIGPLTLPCDFAVYAPCLTGETVDIQATVTDSIGVTSAPYNLTIGY